MIRYFSIALLGLGFGCSGSGADPEVSFEIRGLRNEQHVSATAFGSTVSYEHRGTLIAKGDSGVAHRDYIVFVTVRRMSGGDPGFPRDAQELLSILVHGGVGDIVISGGGRVSYNDKNVTVEAPWAPEVVEISIVGFLPIRPLPPNVVRE